MMLLYYWLAWWLGGTALMLLVWWWNHDVTIGDLLAYAFAGLVVGPLMVALYWFHLWLELRPARESIVLVRRRGS